MKTCGTCRGAGDVAGALRCPTCDGHSVLDDGGAALSADEVFAAALTAFDDAAAGTAASIPEYRVSPDDGGPFTVIPARQPLDIIERSLLAGDVRRRFLQEHTTGVDGFAELRTALRTAR